MRVRGVVLTAIVMLAACGGSTSNASHSPATSPSTEQSSASPTGLTSPNPSASTGPASMVHCASPVPAGDNLVIGSVVGDPTVVVRDIQDPANAKTLCTLDSNAQLPQFVSGATVAYVTPDSTIVAAPLDGRPTSILATFTPGYIHSGQYAISPDGRSITYLDQNSWRISGPSGNRVLANLPAAPNRGINLDEDDSYLAFSPDGQYVALFQTFHVGGSGQTAPDQVRKVSDGTLAYATSGMTMAVWASVPSRLFFRDSGGNLHRWDASAGSNSMTSLHWIRPQSSPDGRWIAYTFRAGSGVDGVGFYSVQANTVQNTTPPARSGVRFLTNDLVWYAGEKPCTAGCAGPTQPSGVTYIYSISGTSEITSRLAAVYDAWPHQTAPGI